jgi:hypothetical protein
VTIELAARKSEPNSPWKSLTPRLRSRGKPPAKQGEIQGDISKRAEFEGGEMKK